MSTWGDGKTKHEQPLLKTVGNKSCLFVSSLAPVPADVLSWEAALSAESCCCCPQESVGGRLSPEQVLGRVCVWGLSAPGLKSLSEQLKLMTAQLWNRLWWWLSWNLPVAGGGRDSQKMGLGSCPGLGYTAESHARAGAGVETSCAGEDTHPGGAGVSGKLCLCRGLREAGRGVAVPKVQLSGCLWGHRSSSDKQLLFAELSVLSCKFCQMGREVKRRQRLWLLRLRRCPVSSVLHKPRGDTARLESRSWLCLHPRRFCGG